MHNQPNGTMVMHAEESSGLQDKRDLSWNGSDKSERKKTLKSTSAAAKLVSKLSPKSTRRKAELKTTLIKV